MEEKAPKTPTQPDKASETGPNTPDANSHLSISPLELSPSNNDSRPATVIKMERGESSNRPSRVLPFRVSTNNNRFRQSSSNGPTQTRVDSPTLGAYNRSPIAQITSILKDTHLGKDKSRPTAQIGCCADVEKVEENPSTTNTDTSDIVMQTGGDCQGEEKS